MTEKHFDAAKITAGVTWSEMYNVWGKTVRRTYVTAGDMVKEYTDRYIPKKSSDEEWASVFATAMDMLDEKSQTLGYQNFVEYFHSKDAI